ncbi:MAG: hypothetical protein K2K54_05235, partial [Lachnospiraceae bacterium]|nr:hypothetical protein [Lachnospiraceae bacterium]
MFKRLLAFMIAGCLVLDAPATAYAASPHIGTAATDSTGKVTETSEDSTGNTLEQTEGQETEEGSGEGKEGEKPTVDAPEAEEDTAKETTDEETDEGGQGETITEETTSAEETTGNITDAETEEGISEEQTEEEGTEESTEPETESGTGEEILLEEESEIYIDAVSEEVTALQFGETNTITLAGVENNNEYIYQWYSFTAPEAGCYILNTGSYVSGDIRLYASVDGNAIRNLADKSLHTDFMEAGETVYFCAYTYLSSDVTVELTLQKLAMFSAAEQEDGSYSFETEDYTLSILPEAGYGNLRVKASIEAKEGKDLEYSYVLVSYYQKIGFGETYSSQYLYRNKDYQAEYSLSADRESEYRLYFILQDTSSRVLGLFDGDIILKTKQTDETIVIFDTEATENSITFDMEAVRYIPYCYYAPTDGSAEEKSLYIGSGWKKYSFTGLQPETEYYFRFVDYSGKTVFETKASTAEAVTKAVYSVVINEDNGQPVLKADISGYTGSETYAYLYYEYTNALGEKKRSYVSKSLSVTDSGEGAGKGAVIEKTFAFSGDVLEAETQYDITVWVEIGGWSLPKKVETITTPKASIDAEKLTFTIEQDGTDAKYTIETDSMENTVYGALYYKHQGAKGSYVSKSISLSDTNTSATGNISGLQSGTAYDFVLLIDGVKKELTQTFGEANVKLTQIGEGEVNAFDIVRAYKLESETESAESYSLALYYWNESSSNYYPVGTSVSLNAENEYQAEIKTASSSFKFVADTDYDLKWELKSGSDVIYTFYETIHTKEANLTWEAEESNYCMQKYKV